MPINIHIYLFIYLFILYRIYVSNNSNMKFSPQVSKPPSLVARRFMSSKTDCKSRGSAGAGSSADPLRQREL